MRTQAIGRAGLSCAVICIFGGAVAAFGQSNLQFTGIQVLTNKEVALTLGLSNAPFYRIETSSNLAPWQALVTLPGSGTSLAHTDSAAPYLNHRLYRAELLNDTNTLSGDHLTTSDGDVVFHPIRHATFVMTWQGKTIYNDPTNAAAPFPGLPKADLILVTHVHTDHFNGQTLDAVRGPNCVIVTSQNVYNSMSTALRGITKVLGYGGTTNVTGINIEAVPAYNPVYHPYGTGNGYVLTTGGKRIYIAGDTGDVTEMRTLSNIDVAFIPMNLPYTMSTSNAAAIVRDFLPKVVYPYHFKNQDQTLADLNDFKRRVGQDLGIEVRLRKWY